MTADRSTIPILIALVACPLPPTAAADLRDSLRPQEIESVRINLDFVGAGLGFEAVLAGDDPGVEVLAAVIREAELGAAVLVGWSEDRIESFAEVTRAGTLEHPWALESGLPILVARGPILSWPELRRRLRHFI